MTYVGGKGQTIKEIKKKRTRLLVKLPRDEDVLNIRIIPCSDAHGCILEQRNATLELGDLLDAQLAFLRHGGRKSSGILLHIPNVTLDRQPTA